jgi:tRNA A-37 threonylcarbamoyl transferase component Bud32
MSDSFANPRFCEKCGATLPSHDTDGLCPRCLMAGAMMATQPDAHTTSATLPPDELAPHFPQLEIIECLGRGGMGVVYKARQKSLDRLVALKLLAPERVTDAEFAKRFAGEAKALAALNHPNIVTIHDFGQAGGYYYFLMEFVDGVNLRQAMKAGRFTPEQALAIVPPVCDALQYAHEHGIVHRDIKPENLLLDKDGRVKIADFGIAKILGGEAALTSADAQTGSVEEGETTAGVSPSHMATLASVAGTPQYMAPEQTTGPRRADSRADIYSLGVVLYEMLTGELPGTQIEAPSRKVRIDVRLDEVVLRALEQSPELRWQTAGIFKTQVETIVGSGDAVVAVNPLPHYLQGYEYKSKRTLFGLPLLHVTWGMDPRTGRAWHARGIVAVGGVATGVLAMGGRAYGGIAFGGIACGGVAIGGVAAGILSFGGLSLALALAVGGLAIAPVALGGLAVGYLAAGGLAFGAHILDSSHADRDALRLLQGKGSYNLSMALLVLWGVLFGLCYFITNWARKRNSSPPSMRDHPETPKRFSFAAISGATWAAYAVMTVVFSVLAFQWWSRREPAGVWMPTPISDSIGEQFGRAQLRVTDVSRTGQVVLVDFVCETLESDHELIVQYSGPVPGYPANLVSSVKTNGKAPDCLISPTSMIGGTKLGMGDVLAGSRDMAGRQAFQIGYVLPDEKTADQVVGQVRQVHLGKPRGLTEKGSVLLLFALHRNAGKDPDGKPVSEGLSGMLFWSPKQKPSFGPVVERGVGRDDAPVNQSERIVILKSPDKGTAELLDLDTGRLATNSNFGTNDRETHAWIRSNRMDVLGVIEKGHVAVLCMDMIIVPALNNGWENITAQTVMGDLRLDQGEPNKITGISPDTDKTDTFLFRTREGGKGMLQILGQETNPPGVKIRYKLVQRTTDGPPQAQSVFDLHPVIELTIPMDRDGLTDMFDPETGQIIPSPNPYGAPQGQPRTSRKGLLIKHDSQANRTELVGMNGVMTQESRADQWDGITNLQALKTLRRNYMSEGGSVGAVVGGDGTHTFLFKTGNGRIGLLQITGFTENPRGVKIRYKLVQNAPPASVDKKAATPVDRHDQIAVEDLALQMIVAIREKDDNKLRSLACDRVKGWRDALPVFAVELREHYRQSTGNESFDMRAGESLVDGDLAAVKCTGPKELTGKCLVLFFVKTADGWRNHSLRASMENIPLAQQMANLKKEIQKEGTTSNTPVQNH